MLSIHNIKGQNTPEEMGKFIFNSIQQNSLNKIIALFPPWEEMKEVATLFGLEKNPTKYNEVINGYQTEVDAFHENLNLVYSDTFDTGLKWKMAKLEKVTKFIDSIPVDAQNPNGKKVPTVIVKIYLTCDSNRFVIVLDDVFPIRDLWKTGSSIYMKKLKS